MTRMIRLFLAAGLAAITGSVQAADPADHPLIGRYEGSRIESYQSRAFDEYVLPLGSLEDGAFADTQPVEGRITWIGYRNPDGRSTLEIFRNYQEKLAGEDFEELFVCESTDACGHWFATRIFEGDPERYLHSGDTGADEGIHYVAAKRGDGARNIYAQIVVYDDGNDVWTRVRVIEEEPRESDKIVVEADEMAQQIDEAGSVALYGILFDYDKATLRPESAPTLEEIAKLLNDTPDLDLLVVGHTDNQGGLDYNRDLSQRRAEAVVEALVTRHGIDRSRLSPHGVAYLAPAASNATEDGRAENRRVELVRQ